MDLRRTAALAAVAALASPTQARAAGALALADEAVARNPGLTALARRIEALERQAEGAERFADPMLAVEYGAMPWDRPWPGGSPMSGVQVKLQQTLPPLGINERRRAAAGARVEVSRQALAEARVRLRGLVRQTYWRLALSRRLAALTRSHVQQIDRLLLAVEARYRVGRGGQQDLLALQVRRGRLSDTLGDFERDERSLTARLNAARHADADTPVPTPAPFPAEPPEVSLEALIARAEAARPLVREVERRAAALRLDADRLALEGKPGITLWAGWRLRAAAGMDDGTDFVSVGAAVPLPLDWSDRWPAERQARLRQAAAEDARREALLDEVTAGLADALARWRRGADQAATLQQALIPVARSALTATVAAYQTGGADFATLFQAELRLIDLERDRLRALFAAAAARAAVDALTGETGQREVATR